MKNVLASFLLLVAGLCLPLTLNGQNQQADTLSSIVGKTFYRMEIGNAGQALGIETLDTPVSRIEVILVAAGDTLRTKTDDQGRFSFSGIAAGSVTLSMVNDDYAPFSESFVLMPGDNVVIVPRQRKVETLDAATVTAEAPVMTMRGDTLVYHAAALRVEEGDYAIDLLKQMPGVEVNRMTGEINISGKNVKRSYVNGALIFGLTPIDAMENLRAEQVVTMEVYDETDPEEIIDRRAREKQRVVNIKTKDPIFNATDLQVRAIAGADETRQENGDRQYRYAFGTNAHFFSELEQLSADVVTNNVGMGTSAISAVPEPQTAYRATTNLELGFNHYWESPLFGNGLNTRYIFSHDVQKGRSRRLQEYFELPQSPAHTIEEETSSSQMTESHGIEANFALKTWDVAVVTWRQKFGISHNLSNGRTAGSTVYNGMTPMLREETSSSEGRGWSLSESVNVRFKSGKNGKPAPILTLGVNLRKNDLDAWNLDTLASSYTKRYLTKEGNNLNQSWAVNLSQTLYEFRKDQRRIEVTGMYNMNYNLRSRVQEAFDLYGVVEPVPNKANTYDFTDSYLTHELTFRTLFLTGNPKFPSLNLSVRLAANQIKDRKALPASVSADRTYYSILPTLSFTTGRFSWNLSASEQSLSLEQLRRRIDDTRPLSLVAGNPDLRISQTYNLRLQKTPRMQAKKWTTTWNASVQYQRHPLVQRQIFYREAAILDDYDGYRVPAGASVLRTENADFGLGANITLNTSARLSLLKGKLKPTVKIQPKLDYRLMPQYFGEVLDRTAEWTPSLNATLMAPLWKGAELSLNGNAAYIRAISQESTMDRKAFRGQLDVDFSTDFLKYAFFSGDYSWRPVRDLSIQSMSRDLHQLNLALGLNFLKKDLKIRLRGIDLLRSGSVYTITMGPSSVTHSWTPVYGRYFVLDISYRFNNSGGRSMPRYGL
jgi:hypothetical protein